VSADDKNELEYEILEEKAASLFRITKKMETALEALRTLDRKVGPVPATEQLQRRTMLLAEAGEAVWFFIIQRECLKLPHHETIYEEYGISEEVRRYMGPKEEVLKALRSRQQ
jgi:hypothetical protein